MLDEVLVDAAGHRHQHRERLLSPSARATRLLPGGGHAAGVAGHHHGVQPADVHSHLERRGGRHAQQLTLKQTPLDLAALRREIATAVRHESPLDAAALQRLPGIAEDQLRLCAGDGEADVPHPPAGQRHHEVAGLEVRAPPASSGPLDDRRVPEDKHAAALGRAIPVNQRVVHPGQGLAELLRVRDGRRAADELGL